MKEIEPMREQPKATPEPVDPATPDEWQEAVDIASAMLLINAAVRYGLVTGGPAVAVSRCEEILRRGLAQGITPREFAAERTVAAWQTATAPAGEPVVLYPKHHARCGFNDLTRHGPCTCGEAERAEAAALAAAESGELTDYRLNELFLFIVNGAIPAGAFVKHFAAAYTAADRENKVLLRSAAVALAGKYKLLTKAEEIERAARGADFRGE